MKEIANISLLILLAGLCVFSIGIGVFDWFGGLPVEKIAFASDRDGDSEIFIMDFDGSDVKQLTFNNEKDQCPSLSSNGKKIAFQATINHDNVKIFVTESTAYKLIQITFREEFGSQPSWSPDGSKIAFISSNSAGDSEIFIMTAYGSGRTQLTENNAADFDPSWSP